jgi:hypothetical protein
MSRIGFGNPRKRGNLVHQNEGTVDEMMKMLGERDEGKNVKNR